MAYSYVEFTSNSSANSGKDYTYSFGAVTHDTANIKVTVGGQTLATSLYTVTQGTVTLSAAPGSGSAPLDNPLSSANVMRVFRQTNRTSAEVTFSSASVLQDSDLNTATDQGRYLALEAVDRANESITIDENNAARYNVQVDGADKRIFGIATPVDDKDAVPKSYADSTVSQAQTYADNASSSANTASGHVDTASNWATKTDGAVSGGEFSSKAHASSTDSNSPTGGSSKGWAQTAKNTQVPGAGTSDRSAKHYSEVAADHKTDAETAKNAAESALNTFQGQYHGSLTSAPSSNVDTGDLYFQSSGDVGLKVYNGSSWESLETEVGGNVITSTTGNNLNLVTPSNSNKVVINSGSNTIQLPNVRASENNYVLTMTDKTTGETGWQETQVAPTISGITSGQLNSYYDADGTTVSNDKGGTLVIAGADFGTNIGNITAVRICASDGSTQVNATTLASLSDTSITATWNGTESGYSTFSGVYHIEIVKSGLSSNRFNSTKSFSGDPTISSVTGANGDLFSGTVSSSNLGTYGGTIAGGGQDSNTKLLLNFDRTGGTDFEDSSNTGGNGHKITASGNAVIKASPFGDGKTAIFFDGSSDYLHIDQSSATNADFDFGTSTDYTIEGWYKATTRAAGYAGIIGTYSAQTAGYSLGLVHHNYTTDGAIQFSLCLTTNNYTNALLCGGSVSARFEEWIHFALVRSGSTTSMYINGKLADSTTTSINMASSSGLRIGSNGTDNTSDVMNGYLDEIRIVKGTAVYTGDFDVPTSRLTAITNTKLLIHSNLEVGDSSSHKRPVYAYGPIQISDSVAKTNRGSTTHTNWNSSAWQSDGVGDKLEIPFPDIGTGDFTIDFWVYPQTPASSATDNDIILIDSRRGGTTGWFLSWHKTNNTWRLYNFDGSTQDDHTFSGVTSAVDGWDHVAIQRSSGTIRLWVNGTQASNTDSHSNELKTGSYGAINIFINESSNNAHAFKGYLDEFRISSVARYSSTTTISVPTGAYTSDDDTLLLLHGDGGVFTDSSSNSPANNTAHTITPTGPHHYDGHGGIAPALPFPASLKKTGSAGAYFGGTTSDKLSISPITAMDFGTGAFTLECWMYPTDVSINYQRVFQFQNTSQSEDEMHIGIGLGYLIYILGGNSWQATTHVVSNNVWQHLAMVRASTSANDTRVYLNGKYMFKFTDDSDYSGNTSAFVEIGNTYKGYIDSVRWSNVQRYHGEQTSGDWSNYLGTSETTPWNQPTKIYGAMFPANPSVGTITITGATTDSTDIAYTDTSTSRTLSSLGLTLTDGGASGATDPNGASVSAMTAHITGTLTDVVSSDTATNNIRIQAKANNDDKRITEVNESNGEGAVSITQKAGGAPVLFNARRYVGTGAVRDINGYGFQPDLIWLKDRTEQHNYNLIDSVRGTPNILMSDSNSAEITDSTDGLTSINSDGFSLGANTAGTQSYELNKDGNAFIAWGFKAGGSPSGNGKRKRSNSATEDSLSSGADGDYNNITEVQQSVNVEGDFSITKYKGGNGTSNNFFKHGLSGKPDWVIIKRLTSAHWVAWHSYGDSGNAGAGDWILLSEGKAWGIDENNNAQTYAFFGTGGITNDKIHLQNEQGWTNYNNTEFICYAWKAVKGVSAFGSYTGNAGNVTVTYPQINNEANQFSARFIMVKCITTNAWWVISDTTRGITNRLFANDNAYEETDTGTQNFYPTITSTGFSYPSSVTHDNHNANGETYIYMAFA